MLSYEQDFTFKKHKSHFQVVISRYNKFNLFIEYKIRINYCAKLNNVKTVTYC